MCGDLPCDFEAQGAAHASGAQLFFACQIISIVLYIVGGVAACAYHKQALVVFAGGIVFVEILFVVSCIILTVAPTEVFKASFLWATASGYDPNGVAYCTRDWLTAVDGLLGFGTITRCTPRLSPAAFAPRGLSRRRPARPCHPPPPPARHRASERMHLARLRGPVGHRPRHLRPHALRVYKARRDIIEGANVHGGEEGGVPMQATATATATAPVAMATATAAPVAMATATAVPMATATPMATAVPSATPVATATA